MMDSAIATVGVVCGVILAVMLIYFTVANIWREIKARAELRRYLEDR